MKIYKEINIYKIKLETLPEEGWFQGCMRCCAITSYTKKIKTRYTCSQIIEYYIYLCRECQKRLEDPILENKFKKKCDNYIKKHFFN